MQNFEYLIHNSLLRMDTAWWASKLGIPNNEIILCTAPNAPQLFCLTFRHFFHISCSLLISISFDKIETVEYKNKNIRIVVEGGKEYTYAIESLAITNEDESVYAKLGESIVSVITELKQISIYGKNNIKQVP